VAEIGQASIQTLAHDTSQRPNFGMATGGHNPNSPLDACYQVKSCLRVIEALMTTIYLTNL
jgi:hypothetical protein